MSGTAVALVAFLVFALVLAASVAPHLAQVAEGLSLAKQVLP